MQVQEVIEGFRDLPSTSFQTLHCSFDGLDKHAFTEGIANGVPTARALTRGFGDAVSRLCEDGSANEANSTMSILFAGAHETFSFETAND
jgi:hypothetical protein